MVLFQKDALVLFPSCYMQKEALVVFPSPCCSRRKLWFCSLLLVTSRRTLWFCSLLLVTCRRKLWFCFLLLVTSRRKLWLCSLLLVTCRRNFGSIPFSFKLLYAEGSFFFILTHLQSNCYAMSNSNLTFSWNILLQLGMNLFFSLL